MPSDAGAQAPEPDGRRRPAPRRIGVIYPENGVYDAEFARFAPPDVSVHLTRLPWPDPDWFRPDRAERTAGLANDPAITSAARLFVQIAPAAVAYACTAVSFAGGPGGDQPVLAALRRGTAAPVSTAATAFVAACHALGVDRVSIASVYRAELTDRFVAFLDAAGIGTAAHTSEGWDRQPDDDHRLTGADLHRMALACDRRAAQAVLIPETNIHTSTAIPHLEATLGKPVISAIHATVWHAAHLAGSRASTGIGCLGQTAAPLAS
ncbi:Arylmalonate decarboxylase [Amycolatopsis sp. M39]|nr:arylmalonate decarboxylase [Amycolatopsis rubida]OAP26835.1 Arylmalonate decarboxylase [Amycolatopsis sp. M39]